LEVINWVAKRLEVPDSALRIQDAPSAEAWGMLMSYRFSPARKFEFWDKVYVKLIPSRAQLDSSGSVDVGAAKVMETIERLVKIRNEGEDG
jgi:hypothetical protein